jgi:CubicO group peptidase (beta-lactamase class C family)
VLDAAKGLEPLKVVLVSREGERLAERSFNEHSIGASTNIKSASKSIISAMVGIAIDRGLLQGTDQKIAPILQSELPREPDPRMFEITVGNLLSMQAGLARMSGPNYGRWVSSRSWVRFALSEPFDGEPGGQMLYSTASTHLLSAILTRVGEKSTLALAREWFEPVEGFRIGSWEQDPQGIYLGTVTPGLWGNLSRRRQNAGRDPYCVGGLDQAILDTAHQFPLFRRWLWLWLVPAQDRRRGGQIRLGLWRADALYRPVARAHRGDDLGRKFAFGAHRLRDR